MVTAESRVHTTYFAGCEQIAYETRDDWLHARQGWLGSSDAAAILGYGYADQSRLTVWDSKVNALTPEIADAKKRKLRIGKDLEPGLFNVFQSESRLLGYTTDLVAFRHRTLPFVGASIDAVAFEPKPVEAWYPVELKNVGWQLRADWEEDERSAMKHQIQCQHQMGVSGAEHCYLFGLIAGDDPVIKVLERNDRFITNLFNELEDFWGYVTRRELPPVDDSYASYKVLEKLYPVGSGCTQILGDDAEELAKKLRESRATIKAAEADEQSAKNKLAEMIRGSSFALLPSGRTISWKEQTRRLTCPHCRQITSESTFRVMRECK